MSADDETLNVAAHVRRVGLRFRRLLREQPPSWTEMYYPEAPKRSTDQSNCSDRLYAMRRWLGMPLWKHWLVLIVSSLIHALAVRFATSVTLIKSFLCSIEFQLK
jgi:hypothetical protein